jgi:regulator of cell morphogenesis and NO signaling
MALQHPSDSEVTVRPGLPGGGASAATADLIAHIVERYHKGHRIGLPRLIGLARRVEAAHGDRAECPRGLGNLLSGMFEDLEVHQHTEEAVLFPAMANGVETLHHPVARMMRDHAELGELLDFMADITDDLTPPQDACATWRALYAGCGRLDADLREQMQLENSLLRRFL